GYYLYPVFPCLLLALVATHLTSSAAERPSISWQAIAAGACAGVTALIRYDVGFFLLIANLATIVVLVARSTAEARSRRVLAALVAYVAGTAAVFLPAALTFLIVSPVRPFANDIVDYSLKYYRAMRGLPFPGLRDMRKNAGDVAVYLPVLAVGLAMAALALRPRGRSTHATAASLSNDSVPYLLAFTATAGMLFLKGMVRVSPVHMTLAIVSSLIVLAILVEDWGRRGAPLKIAAAVLVLLAAEPAARSMAHELRLDVQDPTRTVAGWLLVPGEGSPAAGGSCEQGPASGLARLGSDYPRVATFIARHTQPGEPILVALNRHDKVFINPIGLYFAAARPPATHWHQFDPGMQTRSDIQTDMIGELERRHVRLVVRDATDEGASEPNGSSVSSRVFLLDRYLASHYRPVAASGPVSVWFLKGETPVAYGARQACEASPS
ncbi:hypothetical protein, partial [Phenylobacterium sp.]|uniref:hypothetical protein n=1 Tax=Phenylobacterium sp. TaxID=1871053 RepID=UPI002F406280